MTNITFFITKIRGHPIGRGTDLPASLAENHGLVALDRNQQTGKIYSDNLWFFRALALHNGRHSKNLERDAKHYHEKYREMLFDKKKFCGVKLKELPDIEHLFEVNIFVYALRPTKQDGEETEDDELDDTQTLLHNWFTVPFATTQVLFTSTCTRITFLISKI